MIAMSEGLILRDRPAGRSSHFRGSRERAWFLRVVAFGLVLLGSTPGLVSAVTYWGTDRHPPDVAGVTELRLKWSQEKHIDPYWEIAKGRNAMFGFLEEGKYERILEIGARWLEAFPIDAEIHRVKAEAHRALAQYDAYFRHMSWAHALYASITASGPSMSMPSAS